MNKEKFGIATGGGLSRRGLREEGTEQDKQPKVDLSLFLSTPC
jgi:hypothetical protein